MTPIDHDFSLPDRVAWWEPWRTHVPRELIAYRGLLSWGLLIRVTAISVVVGGALITWAIWRFPAIQVPWWRVALMPTALAGVLAIHVGVSQRARPRCTVRPHQISVDHGQGGSARVCPEQLLELRVDDGDPPTLLLRYRTTRGHERERRIGVSRRADLAALRAISEAFLSERDR